jgi:hypothetical protein
LLKIEKSPGFAPLNVMLPIVIAVAFPFVSVTTFCPPLFPIATAAHVTVAGETVVAATHLAAGSAHKTIAPICTGRKVPNVSPRQAALNRPHDALDRPASKTATTRFSAKNMYGPRLHRLRAR